MQYFGGKQRTASSLVDAMSPYIERASCWVEPFVGGASMTAEVGKRFPDKQLLCSDANLALITMWQSVTNGWNPPECLTKEEYEAIRLRQDLRDPLTAFAGFGCSFAGKWFGGFAKSGDRNYAANARNSILKKALSFDRARFSRSDYQNLNYPPRSIVYMDPPYEGTTGYSAVGVFDHEAFWGFCRFLSNTGLKVFVSEYSAPEDFYVFYETETKTDIRMKDGSKDARLERLFVYRGGA